MGIVNSVLDALARRIQKRIQDDGTPSGGYRDWCCKGKTFSVEAQVSEALANLTLAGFTMPVDGDSQRAKWLDSLSDSFIQDKLTTAVTMAFLTGDCIVVPMWNGSGMDAVTVSAENFAILSAVGDRITAVAYVVDTKRYSGQKYDLLQTIELTGYTAEDDYAASGCRYRLWVAQNGVVSDANPGDVFDDWKGYEADWMVPNVDRILLGRLKSFTLDPTNPNNAKGLPICFGASQPIKEIHYLLDQLHVEFGMSEKAVFADKSLFKVKRWRDDKGNAQERVELPKGRERLFTPVAGSRNIDSEQLIHDWAPEVRYQAYLETLEKQCQEVEKCVGVSSGIISNVNDQSYQNVDNVRKATVKTQSFVNAARRRAEGFLDDLVYAWNALANYYGFVPMGDFAVSFNWSDDYINTFADQKDALIAGQSIGATDALDYRMFVFNEPPEVARQRIEEIAAAKAAQVPALMGYTVDAASDGAF